MPSLRFLVTAAASINEMKGSYVWRYSFGSSPPPAKGTPAGGNMCMLGATAIRSRLGLCAGSWMGIA